MSPLRWLMKRMHAPVYRARLRALVQHILPHLRKGDNVLDVGCGGGALGRAMMDHPACPEGVTVRGLESAPRGGELIEVNTYDGETMPYEAGTFDVVILADVLHHERRPDQLIAASARLAGRLLVIKDHKRDGLFAQQRIALIDWAANAPYGVPCLFRYNTLDEWRQSHQRHRLLVEAEWPRMKLYPPVYNCLFGGRLQYMAVLRTDRSAEAEETSD